MLDDRVRDFSTWCFISEIKETTGVYKETGEISKPQCIKQEAKFSFIKHRHQRFSVQIFYFNIQHMYYNECWGGMTVRFNFEETNTPAGGNRPVISVLISSLSCFWNSWRNLLIHQRCCMLSSLCLPTWHLHFLKLNLSAKYSLCEVVGEESFRTSHNILACCVHIEHSH